MNILICPVCKNELFFENKLANVKITTALTLQRKDMHLLSAHKSGDSTGDNKEMAKSRRDFLERLLLSLAAAVEIV